MQIAGSHSFDRTRLVSLESNPATADRAEKQQRIRKANDSYSKSAAAAQVIDAEYVDMYSSERSVQQKQQSVDVVFESEATPARQLLDQPAASNYPLQNPDTPPPGTYINYFA